MSIRQKFIMTTIHNKKENTKKKNTKKNTKKQQQHPTTVL